MYVMVIDSEITRFAGRSLLLTSFSSVVQHGVFMAFIGLFWGLVTAPLQVYYLSDQFARSAGAFGCLFGLVLSAFFVAIHAIKAVLVFFDRLAVGIANGIFRKNYDYLIDPSWKAQVFSHGTIEAEVEQYLLQGIPKARRRELTIAFDYVSIAQSIFNSTKPRVPSDHGHFVVAKVSKLIAAL